MTNVDFEVKKFGGNLEDSEGAWEVLDIIDIESEEKVGRAMFIMWDDNTGLIESIDIDEDKQNRGYGTAAIMSLADRVNGCYLAPDNANARRLYERLGREVFTTPWACLDVGYGVFEV